MAREVDPLFFVVWYYNWVEKTYTEQRFGFELQECLRLLGALELRTRIHKDLYGTPVGIEAPEYVQLREKLAELNQKIFPNETQNLPDDPADRDSSD
jgi:hypothetical protein